MKKLKVYVLLSICISIALATHITRAQETKPKAIDMQDLNDRVGKLEEKVLQVYLTTEMIEESMMSRAGLLENFEISIEKFDKKIKEMEKENQLLRFKMNALESVIANTEMGSILKTMPEYLPNQQYQLRASATAYPQISDSATAEKINLPKATVIEVKSSQYSAKTKSWWLEIKTVTFKIQPAKTFWINNEALSGHHLEKVSKSKK